MTPGRRWLAASVLVVIVAGLFFWTFLHLGTWLVVQDPLLPAHAIVILSGRMPERALEAARVYHENGASRVWISRPVSPAIYLAQMHVAYIGEDFYNEKVLIAQGVPSDAIHILELPSANTEEEVDQIARDCRQDDAHKVIIVTSKAHTRRVRLIWRKRVGSDPSLIVRYANEDTFDPEHWWRKTPDVLDVLRETLGIANVWLGFPVRPEAH